MFSLTSLLKFFLLINPFKNLRRGQMIATVLSSQVAPAEACVKKKKKENQKKIYKTFPRKMSNHKKATYNSGTQ